MPPRAKANASNVKKGASAQSANTAAQATQRPQDTKASSAATPKPTATTPDAETSRTASGMPLLPPPQTAAEIPSYVEAYLRLKQQEQQNLEAQRLSYVPQVTKTSFPPVPGVRRGEKGGFVVDRDVTDLATAASRTSKKRPRTDATGTGSTMEILDNSSADDDDDGEPGRDSRAASAPSAGQPTARARAFMEAISDASPARIPEELLEVLQHPDLAFAAGGAIRGVSRRGPDGAAGGAGGFDDGLGTNAATAAHWEHFRNLVTDAQRKAQRQQQQRSSAAENEASSRSPPPAPSEEDVALAVFNEITRISQDRRNRGSAMAAYKNLASDVAAAAGSGGAAGGDGTGTGLTEREVQSAMAESVRQILGMTEYGTRSAAAAAAGLGGVDSRQLAYDEDSDDFINLQLAIEDQKNRMRGLEAIQPETLKEIVENSQSLSFPSTTAVYLDATPSSDDPNRKTVAQRLSESTAVAAAMLLQMLEARALENAAELTLLSQGKEETHRYLTRLHQCLHHELHTLPDDRLIDITRCLGLLGDGDANPDPATLYPDAIFEALSAVGAILFFASLPLSVLEKVCADLGIGTSDEASMDRLVLGEALAEKIAYHLHHVRLSLAQLSFVPRLQVHEHAPGSYTCTVDRASCLGLLPSERLISNRFSCSRIRLRAMLTTSQESCGALSLHVWHRHSTDLTTHMLIRTSEPKKKKKKGGNTPTPVPAAAATEDEVEARASSALFIEQEGVAVPGQCFGFSDFVTLDLALDSPTTLQYGLRTYNKSDDRLVFQLSVSLENMDGTALPASNKQQAVSQQNLNQSFDSVPASTATGTTNHVKGSTRGGGGGGGGGGGVIDNDALLRHAQKQATEDLEQTEGAARAKLEAEWKTSFVHLQNDECRGVRAAKQKHRERLFKAELAKVSAPPELVRESEKLSQSVQNARQQVQKLEKERTKDEKDAAKAEQKLNETSQELERLTAKMQEDRAALAELEKEVKAIQASNDARQLRLRQHSDRKKARSQLRRVAEQKRQQQQQQRQQMLLQQQQQQQQQQLQLQQQQARKMAAAASAVVTSSTSTPAKARGPITSNTMAQRSPLTAVSSSPAVHSPAPPLSAPPTAAAEAATARGVNSLFIPDFGTFMSHNTFDMANATSGVPSNVSSGMMTSSSIPGAGASNSGTAVGAAGGAPALGRLFSTSPATRVQQQQEQQQQQQRRSVPDSPGNGYMTSSGLGDMSLNGRVAGMGGLPPLGTSGNAMANNNSGNNNNNSNPAGNAILTSISPYSHSSPSSPGAAGAAVGASAGPFRTGSFSGSRSPHAPGADDAGGLSPAVGTPASLANSSPQGLPTGPGGAGMFGVSSRLGTNALFTNTSGPFIFSTGAGGPGLPPSSASSQVVGGSGHSSPAAALAGLPSPQQQQQQQLPPQQQQQQQAPTPMFSTKASGGSGASSTVGNNNNDHAGVFSAAPGSMSPPPLPGNNGGSMFQSFQVVGTPANDLSGGGMGGFGLSAFTTNPATRGAYGGVGLESDPHAMDMGMGMGNAHNSLFTVSAGGMGHSSGSPVYAMPGLGFPGDALTGSQGSGGRPMSTGPANLNQLLFHTSPMQVGGAGSAVGAIGSNTPPPGQNPQSPMGGLFENTNVIPYQW